MTFLLSPVREFLTGSLARLREAAAALARGVQRLARRVRAFVESAAVRGVVLALSGEAGVKASALVRGSLRGVWRASSLVECINSVARMQQGRHRKVRQGLLNLKRLYWNCRPFRTGHRREKSPYELQGLPLPTADWWQLQKLAPEELRQHLRQAHGAGPAPPQEVSAPTAAA